ncbi:MAG TPA: biopolymer transporter ExbD [Burkholderiales bacterium]|nr:biopolymer transporter ExbD [Burkholderiales bacterium]
MDADLAEINVVPLVDVMLVLLVIVLTTASFVSTGQIPVQLAKAQHADTSQTAAVKVVLLADGGLTVNDRPVTLTELPAAMASLPRSAQVAVWADKQIPLQRFVGAVDAIKGQGFDRIGLKVER